MDKGLKKVITGVAAVAIVLSMGSTQAYAELHGKVVKEPTVEAVTVSKWDIIDGVYYYWDMNGTRHQIVGKTFEYKPNIMGFYNTEGTLLTVPIPDHPATVEERKTNFYKVMPMPEDRKDLGKGGGVMLPFRTPNYLGGTSAFNENADSSKIEIKKGFMESDKYLIQNDGSTAKWQDKFYSEDGKTLVKNSWKLIDGKWYFFNQSGNAARGWYKIENKIYHFDVATGSMTVSWYQSNDMSDRDNWYYLNPTSGEMLDKTWLEFGGKWYYFGNDNGDTGKMNTGYQNIDGKQYKFDQSGKWIG